MTTITLEEAQSDLAGWIGRLQPGEQVVITLQGQPVARLAAQNGVSTSDDQEARATDRPRDEDWRLLQRITVNPAIFGGKPIIRGQRMAVEHVLGMLAAGDTLEILIEEYPWLEPEDIRACLVYACRLVENERIEPLVIEAGNPG